MSSVVDIHKKKGIRPNFDIYIGRRDNRTEFTKDSKWANYFYGNFGLYEEHVRTALWEDLDELIGQLLGCWCITTNEIYPIICHGQILMKLVKEKGDY